MYENVSDFLIRRLAAWGVRRVFGYPGDGINGVMGALGRATDTVDFIQTRHEEAAAFMACAHAKFTGNLGVCIATSGPGAVHLLNGLYDARLDHQPVLAIVGQQRRAALGGSYQQEIDLVSLFKDVAGAYVQQVSVPEQLRHVLDRAVRIALAQRTVTCIILPNDLQELDAVPVPPHEHGTVHSGLGFTRPQVLPPPTQLQQAADVLNAGARVAMLVGAGAQGAAHEVLACADLLGAGVAKALLGRAVLPDDLPFVTGSIGFLGTRPSWEMMRDCDTLLMVGSGFPYSEYLPPEGQARGVQIDIDPAMLNLRYPMEVGLTGDAGATLRALLPLLRRKDDRRWRQQIEQDVTDWWRLLESRAMADAQPINPQRLFWELSPRLPEGCILTSDAGTAAHWFARDLKLRPGMMASLSGGLASMGSGVPYAIAAKFAHPERPVIALVGDGAMQMNGNSELVTAMKYWQRWDNPCLVVLVLNNGDLNLVSWEQRVNSGEPKFEGSQLLPDFPYAAYAGLLGFDSIRVDHPDQIGAAWDRALAADRPVVIEAVTDPRVPPLPPHITAKQARAYLAALWKGDPDAGGILKASLKEMLAGVTHR